MPDPELQRRPALQSPEVQERSWQTVWIGDLRNQIAALAERLARLERERAINGLMVTNAQQARNDAERLYAQAATALRRIGEMRQDMGVLHAAAEELLAGIRRRAKRVRETR